MRRMYQVGFLVLVLVALSTMTIVLRPLTRTSAATSPAPANRWVANYGKLPLSFIANQGQTDGRVKFLSGGSGYMLFLTDAEAILTLKKSSVVSGQSSVSARVAPTFRSANGIEAALRNPLTLSMPKEESQNEVEKPRDRRTGASLPSSSPRLVDNGESSAVLRMRLVGANASVAVTGAELPGKSNYFVGNDSKKWRTNVPTYAKVRYAGVYPGVELVYYGNQGGQLEYDFVVAPGATRKGRNCAISVRDLAKPFLLSNNRLGMQLPIRKGPVYITHRRAGSFVTSWV